MSGAFKPAERKILANPVARQEYYAEVTARRRKLQQQASALESEISNLKSARIKALYDRIGYDPDAAEQRLKEKVAATVDRKDDDERRLEFERLRRVEQDLRLHFIAVEHRLRELGLR